MRLSINQNSKVGMLKTDNKTVILRTPILHKISSQKSRFKIGTARIYKYCMMTFANVCRIFGITQGRSLGR